MMVYGPVIKEEVVIPEHTELQLKLAAYWNLDFDGTPLNETSPPVLLYAKVAYPTLRAAQAEFDIQQAALRERHRHVPRKRSARGGSR
jgi:hypothetical protein